MEPEDELSSNSTVLTEELEGLLAVLSNPLDGVELELVSLLTISLAVLLLDGSVDPAVAEEELLSPPPEKLFASGPLSSAPDELDSVLLSFAAVDEELRPFEPEELSDSSLTSADEELD